MKMMFLIQFHFYESLIDMGDYYYNYDTEYDQKIFEKLIDADFPGYIDFIRSIELFHSKFKLREIDISLNKINWPDSDSDSDGDGVDSDEINNVFGSGEDSESDSDSD